MGTSEWECRMRRPRGEEEVASDWKKTMITDLYGLAGRMLLIEERLPAAPTYARHAFWKSAGNWRPVHGSGAKPTS